MLKAANLSALPHIEHGFGHANEPSKPPVLLYLDQQHAGQVVQVKGHEQAGLIQADALFTTSNRPIAVITADCLPILISSTERPFVAAIHAGWQGLVANIINHSFAAFEAFGIPRHSLRVAIGPSIKKCCYEVSWPLLERIEQVHGELCTTAPALWHKQQPISRNPSKQAAVNGGELWLDLEAYCRRLLSRELDDQQIEVSEQCTYCSAQNLDSYRRRQHFPQARAPQYSWIGLTL
ncbi:polyphenol oxidase family protein [Pseudomonas sp. 5P_3.1_Bac2]|uniref:polyphenol oxidase family protein n=1 Tax=Pseudomonas sp. 5P_3.1_Bac2 TaxID=2971617 RepID=UPI0021C695E5|nr:polyphenol oxidase family protein [Pseudomonas sp. 5P_3.1_Bac2]MCU1716885.1 polyphenol oxidase family protein [Pseudomonas sp. 5P_3.1_Bac2]